VSKCTWTPFAPCTRDTITRQAMTGGTNISPVCRRFGRSIPMMSMQASFTGWAWPGPQDQANKGFNNGGKRSPSSCLFSSSIPTIQARRTHYIIHAADTSELAAEALPAARKYAAIAPDSPHALHMPSHIFNRLGYWKDSIETNQASARVAAEWTKAGRDGKFDELHALNNIEYAYLQLGQDNRAHQIIKQIEEVANTGTDRWLAIDARIYYDLETHNWQDALKIEPPTGSGFDENFDAYWIETIAAARSGNANRAEQALERYRKSSAAWDKEHGWGDVLGVALTEAQAWTMFSEGKREEAVTHLRAIAQYDRDHPMYYADSASAEWRDAGRHIVADG